MVVGLVVVDDVVTSIDVVDEIVVDDEPVDEGETLVVLAHKLESLEQP